MTGASSGTTTKAGQVYNDLVRLAHYPRKDGMCRRFFMYYTEDFMAKYWRNQKHDFFDLEVGETLTIPDSFLRSLPEEAQKHITHPDDIEVTAYFRAEIVGDFFRVYEVLTKCNTDRL